MLKYIKRILLSLLLFGFLPVCAWAMELRSERSQRYAQEISQMNFDANHKHIQRNAGSAHVLLEFHLRMNRILLKISKLQDVPERIALLKELGLKIKSSGYDVNQSFLDKDKGFGKSEDLTYKLTKFFDRSNSDYSQYFFLIFFFAGTNINDIDDPVIQQPAFFSLAQFEEQAFDALSVILPQANLNLTNKLNHTFFHNLCEDRYIHRKANYELAKEMITLLLKHGADINAIAIDPNAFSQKTPLDFLIKARGLEQKWKPIIQLFRDNGAKTAAELGSVDVAIKKANVNET